MNSATWHKPCGRREALTLLAGGLAAATSGCTARRDRRPALRYMAWGTPEQLAVEQQLVDAFLKREPGITVTLFKVPQSAYLQKMTIMLASRTAPDVLRVDHYNFPDLVRKDYFHDLTALAKIDPDFHRDDFYAQCIDEGLYQGRLYGLNVLFGGIIGYYNGPCSRRQVRPILTNSTSRDSGRMTRCWTRRGASPDSTAADAQASSE